MINLKSKEEIEKMSQGGKILAEILSEVLSHVKPGVSELELDTLAEKLIIEKGAEPGFKKVKGYHHTICISTNDVVVHGVPGNYRFKYGDIVGVDCGVFYRGFHTDMAETVRIQSPCQRRGLPKAAEFRAQNGPADKFLKTGKRALEEAIKVAKVGNRIGHISRTIQAIIEEAGYSVVRNFVGHGIGRRLHEEPEVPGFFTKSINHTPFLEEGLTVAIEVIYNMGKSDVVYGGKDNWTIKTKDGSMSAMFEKTIAVTKKGPIILTI